MIQDNGQPMAGIGTRLAAPLVLVIVALLVLAGCGTAPQTQPDTQPASEDAPPQDGTGTLAFRANGEDFVRQGFVSKDGWAITFDHVYVTLADITAYQADPPFDAREGGTPQFQTNAALEGSHTVDLAEGDEDAAPLPIGAVDAPAGRYNALSWRMVPADDGGPASGGVIVMQGTATQESETIEFTIRLGQEEAYSCGDYVGDERKGILEPAGQADLEATFHFDHLFGDGDLPADDDLNRDALGFAPFAALAEQGRVDVDMAALEQAFSAEEREKLMNLHLAHVGEGHCHGSTE
jgi:hypothetical protein